MTPEAKVKKKVVEQLKKIKAYYFYPMTHGYGRSGVPDIVGCFESLFFGIECKAKGSKPTALQQKNLDEITKAGGIALVIDEHNVDQVIELITEGYWGN